MGVAKNANIRFSLENGERCGLRSDLYRPPCLSKAVRTWTTDAELFSTENFRDRRQSNSERR